MIHVGEQATDADLSGGLLEEERLHRRRGDRPQRRDEQQQTAEAGRLAREPRPQVVAEDALRLVLQQLHRPGVGQTRRLCRDIDGGGAGRVGSGQGQVRVILS